MESTKLPFIINDVWYIIIAILTEVRVPEGISEEPADWTWRVKTLSTLLPGLQDLISISSTSKQLRELLAPRIFKTLYLYNTAKSARAVQAIAQGRHSACVKELHYIGITDEGSSPENIYPAEIDNVLSNLARFPALHHLSVDFPTFRGERDIFEEYFLESYEYMSAQEKENPWYRLMTASMNAIASSYAGKTQLPSFEMHHLNILNVRTFSTDVCRHFLSQLKCFSLSTKSRDADLAYCIKIMEGYITFTEYLGPRLLEKLTSVEEFTFDPSCHFTLGALKKYPGQHYHVEDKYFGYELDIGLANANMPNLRKLTLRNINVCPEMRDFIIRHLGTLEYVELHECYANNEDFLSDAEQEDNHAAENDPERIIWHSLFTRLTQELEQRKADSLPMRLREFIVSFEKPKLAMRGFDCHWVDPGRLARAEAKEKAEPGAKVFFYSRLFPDYGCLMDAKPTTLVHFLRGYDEQCFRGLQAAIKAIENDVR